MPVIDRNILRLGVYELLFQSATPAKVIINEAIEIAKDFAADETPQFINGVLDKVASLRKY
jgi:N utilization substance protein B